MEQINDFLKDVTLSNYADMFKGKGYDSLDHPFAMDGTIRSIETQSID